MVSRNQRAIAIGAIVIAVLIVVWMVTRSGGYYVYANFSTAGQLVKGGQVLIGGQPVGVIKDISLTSDNQARIKMKVDADDLTPLHQGTSATIRLTSLAGVANRYISLVPGPNNGPKIPNGGLIPADDTHPPIDLDQFFKMLDTKTRENLQQFIRGFGQWYQDNPNTPLKEATYANIAAKYFPSFFASGAILAQRVGGDQQLLSAFLKEASNAAAIFASQKQHLGNIFDELTVFSRAVSQQANQLDLALAVLPAALTNGRQAFERLIPAMDAIENLADKAMPATEDLAPFLRRLRPLLRNATPVIANFNAIVRKSGGNNDLYDLLAGFPAVYNKATTAFPASVTAMQSGQILLEFLRPYTPELTSWFSHFGQVAANYDANGHYVRVQPVTGRFTNSGGTLNPVPAGQALQDYPKTGVDRCPGSGQQSAGDGSNPFVYSGSDCNPALVMPGP